MDEAGLIFQMFSDGELTFADTEHAPLNPSFPQVLRAWREGKLIGANGSSVVFATCPKCKWKGHTHFTIGDEERDYAYSELERKHSFLKKCEAELEFNERNC